MSAKSRLHRIIARARLAESIERIVRARPALARLKARKSTTRRRQLNSRSRFDSRSRHIFLAFSRIAASADESFRFIATFASKACLTSNQIRRERASRVEASQRARMSQSNFSWGAMS
jgi:hypothetical protein